MRNWTWQEYDPFHPKLIERGEIDAGRAIDLFRTYDWSRRLQEVGKNAGRDVHHAPGFEISDADGRTLYVGGAGDGQRVSYVVAYIRPRMVRKLTLLGFKEKLEPKHYTDKEVANPDEVEILEGSIK
jgi:hypothetical protein